MCTSIVIYLRNYSLCRDFRQYINKCTICISLVVDFGLMNVLAIVLVLVKVLDNM